MKLYECLKEVVDKKLIYKVAGRNLMFCFTNNNLAFICKSPYTEEWTVFEDRTMPEIPLFKEIKILDPILEENKPYYEALGRIGG